MNGNGTPLFINYPTLRAECHDTEARSLKKITDILYDSLQELKDIDIDIDLSDIDFGELLDIIKEIKDLNEQLVEAIDKIKSEDLVRSTSGSFVTHFVAFGPLTELRQVDCFSIATALRWVFIFDGIDTTSFPIFIAPIWPNMSTSFMVPGPFQKGVTVGLSIYPSVYQEESVDSLLVTAIALGEAIVAPPTQSLWDGGITGWDDGTTFWDET